MYDVNGDENFIFAKPCISACGTENDVLNFGGDFVDMDMISRWERTVVMSLPEI